jgi:Family of unknown function (DUF5946)
MAVTSVCPGCGVELPATGLPADLRRNASEECWQVYGEITGFELNHIAELGRYHQLTVDAYGAQHANADGSGIRVAYSLVGLFLALERGMNGLAVRQLHQRMGKPGPSWPRFPRPDDTGRLTVLDVATAGARAGSVPGHAGSVTKWASSVWQAWSAQHQTVAALAERFPGAT